MFRQAQHERKKFYNPVPADRSIYSQVNAALSTLSVRAELVEAYERNKIYINPSKTSSVRTELVEVSEREKKIFIRSKLENEPLF
jgi:hypothetical protein